MTAFTKAAAARFYHRASPLHGRSTASKADLAEIANATQPMAQAEKLVAQRHREIIEIKIEAMLREHQGRRKRYAYNQEAVIGIEHLIDGPLDPNTQMPIWREMLAVTKGKTMLKADFMRGAYTILSQPSLYSPTPITN